MTLKYTTSELVRAARGLSSVVPNATGADVRDSALHIGVRKGALEILGADTGYSNFAQYIIPPATADAPKVDIEPVAICADAFVGIIGELAGDTVDIEFNDGGVWASSGLAKFVLRVYEPQNHPVRKMPVSTANAELEFSVGAEGFVEALRRLAILTSKDTTAHQKLQGVCLTASNGELELKGADGFRVGATIRDSKGMIETPRVFTIDRNTAIRIVKVLNGWVGDVALTLSDRFLSLSVGYDTDNGVRFDTGLLIMGEQAKLPDMDKLFSPDKVVCDIVVDVADLRRAVKSGRVFSDYLRFTVDDDRVVASATNDDLGMFKRELSAKGRFDDSAFEIGFNARYLLDMLSPAKQGNVRCQFISKNSPAQFELSDAPDLKHLLMPVMIGVKAK